MKKFLLWVGITCSALLLVAAVFLFVKYQNLRNDKNYTPISFSDFVYNAFADHPGGAVSKYIRTVSEESLDDNLILRKAEVICEHERRIVYYIGIDSFLGRYYKCIDTDYDYCFHALNLRSIDTDGKNPEYLCFTLQLPDHTVILAVSRYPLKDSYQGAATLCFEPDKRHLVDNMDGDALLQFFVLPRVEELPDSYLLSCDYFSITKSDILKWIDKSPSTPSWK